jgi:hypothetical protein
VRRLEIDFLWTSTRPRTCSLEFHDSPSSQPSPFLQPGYSGEKAAKRRRQGGELVSCGEGDGGRGRIALALHPLHSDLPSRLPGPLSRPLSSPLIRPGYSAVVTRALIDFREEDSRAKVDFEILVIRGWPDMEIECSKASRPFPDLFRTYSRLYIDSRDVYPWNRVISKALSFTRQPNVLKALAKCIATGIMTAGILLASQSAYIPFQLLSNFD